MVGGVAAGVRSGVVALDAVVLLEGRPSGVGVGAGAGVGVGVAATPMSSNTVCDDMV